LRTVKLPSDLSMKIGSDLLEEVKNVKRMQEGIYRIFYKDGSWEEWYSLFNDWFLGEFSHL